VLRASKRAITSGSIAVPPAGRAADREHAVERGQPPLDAAQPRAPARIGAPWPLSVTPIRSIPSACRMTIQVCRASACLDTLASSSLTAK
jgi:hypothetical protein